MKLRYTVVIVLVAVLAASSAMGQEEEPKRPWFFSFGAGFVNPSLSAVNDYVAVQQQDSMRLVNAQNTEIQSFGWDLEVLFEFGKKLSDRFLLSVVGSHSSQKINGDYSTIEGHSYYRPQVDLIDISAKGRYLVTTSGTFVAATAGAGLGKFSEIVSFDDASNQQNSQWSSSYTGSSLSLGAGVGHWYQISRGAVVTLEFGYRYRDLGTFSGERSGSDIPYYEGPALDADGNELKFNFSGFYADVAVVLEL